MKNNKLYMPADALSRHEDFDLYYEDGELALNVKGAWSEESDKIAIIGRKGGEIGHIKPDHKTLAYYVRVERYEYVLHTIRIFESYSFDGMLWRISGALATPPLNFINETTSEKDIRVRLTDFRDKGTCLEIKAKDVAKLRIAAAATIAIAIKEEYKGLSEGEEQENTGKLDKLKGFLRQGKGIPYEDLCAERELTH